MAIEKLPSVHEAAPAIMSGSLHPRELVDFCLARINQFDDRLRAWVLVDADGARREADRLGELARRRWLGPLHGIPIGIKDIVDVQRLAHACRFAVAARRRRPRTLRSCVGCAAGAILLGKTVTVSSLVSIRRRLAILGI
ncbi:MAG: amidase family protein [Pirellulaceae bacterium]